VTNVEAEHVADMLWDLVKEKPQLHPTIKEVGECLSRGLPQICPDFDRANFLSAAGCILQATGPKWPDKNNEEYVKALYPKARLCYSGGSVSHRQAGGHYVNLRNNWLRRFANLLGAASEAMSVFGELLWSGGCTSLYTIGENAWREAAIKFCGRSEEEAGDPKWVQVLDEKTGRYIVA